MSVGPADPKSLQALPTWVVGPPIPPGVRIGKLLQGEYLIKGILGEGELGVTYEAENARLRRKFAVLMLKRELKPTQGMMLQVRDDLRHAEPLMNAGIMPVKMIVDHMMIPGFATELLEGETLRARLSRGPLPPPRALAIILAVARAMDALHKAGAVHGDLRPENIFLVRPGAKSAFAGRVMVVEHALHALRRRSQGLDDQLPLYKLMYRPPECLAGESGPHVGGDVFVLGAILHECLTGRPAFYDEVADFVIDNLNQPPKPIAPNPSIGLTPELASTLSVLVASACARDPQMRTPDMAEIIVAIEQVVQGAGLVLPTVVTEEPQAAPAAPATPTVSRMNRLLNRLSGVFPQVPLPPAADAARGASPGAADNKAAQRPTAPPAASSAPVATPPQSITVPPIAGQRAKVTRLLQKLSGVFPVLQVSPNGEVETVQSSQPKLAGGATANQPPVQSPPPAAAPAAEKPADGSAVPAALPMNMAAPGAVQAAPGAGPVAPLSVQAASGSAQAAAAPPQSAQPTLVFDEQPAVKPALLADQPTLQAADGASHAAAGPAPPAPPPGPAEPTTQPVADKPASDKLATRPKTVPPLSAPEQATSPGAAHLPPAGGSPAAEPAAAHPVVAAADAAPPAAVASSEHAAAGKSSEVAKALALLRQQQQARAAGQHSDAMRAGAPPATPEFVVPAFMAAPSGPASTRSPHVQATAAPADKTAEAAAAPSSTSQRPTAPPVLAHPAAAPPAMEEPLAAAPAPTSAVVPGAGAPAGAAATGAATTATGGSPLAGAVVPGAGAPAGAAATGGGLPAGVAGAGSLAGAGGHAEAVTPAVSLPPSAFSPTSERPPTAPAPANIAYDSTLQPDDLADFLEAANSLAESSRGPTTLSDVPTRPAALAGLEPIPQYSEAKTQPALRRLPITEQATQAKLNPDLFALATPVKAAIPDHAEKDAAAPASSPVVAAAPAAHTAPVVLGPSTPVAVQVAAPAATPVPAPTPPATAPPADIVPAVQRDSILELEPLSLVPEPEASASPLPDKPPLPPPPPADKPGRQRPPRVSQLIKALQQGQIDPLAAMQQASGGGTRDPAAARGPRPTGANPPATGGQPVGPASATGSGPVQGRVSPGLMPMAPAPPSSGAGDSPWGTATQQVTPAPRPGAQVPVPMPAGTWLRGFVLRNQELVAAVFGALLVMLVGLLYLLLR